MTKKKNKTDYIINDKGEGGSKINNIIGSSPEFIVFMNENNALRWELDDENKPDFFDDCIALFDKYQSMITISVPSNKKSKKLKESLGRALYSAVIAKNGQESVKKFGSISNRIHSEIQFYARLHYVFASVFTTSILCIVLALLYFFGYINQLLPFWIGACAGSIGSSISILLRSSTLEIPLFTSPVEHAFQGVARVLLGVLSGLVLVILIHADILLVFAKDSIYTITAFSVVAGFSERYLPNILFDLENNSSTNHNYS